MKTHIYKYITVPINNIDWFTLVVYVWWDAFSSLFSFLFLLRSIMLVWNSISRRIRLLVVYIHILMDRSSFFFLSFQSYKRYISAWILLNNNGFGGLILIITHFANFNSITIICQRNHLTLYLNLNSKKGNNDINEKSWQLMRNKCCRSRCKSKSSPNPLSSITITISSNHDHVT